MPFDIPFNDAPDNADWLNPTLVAQIGSRIYNEFPGASEASPLAAKTTLGAAPGCELLPDAAQKLLSQLNPGALGNTTHFAGDGLEALPDNLPQFGQLPPLPNFGHLEGFKHGTAPDGISSVADGKLPQQTQPLSVHADNLIVKQTFDGDDSHEPSLAGFVHRQQSNGSGNWEGAPADALHLLGLGGWGGVQSDALPFSPASNNPFSHQTNHPTASDYYFLPKQTNVFSGHEGFDVEAIRRDFPVLNQRVHGKPLIWFDNAATTQKPNSVIDALSRFYRTDNSNIHRAAHTLAARSTDAYEGAREKVRRFIGASSTDEIVFVRGTTEGINLVAQTWGRKFIQPGDEILVSLLEHHANIVPWQMLAKEKGAVLKAIPVNDNGEILMDEYVRLLNPKVKLLAVTQASNGLGTILPVKEMIELARRYDIKVLVDGAQSVAHLAVDVQQLDADFFVFSGHKIFAPNGIGVVYGKRQLLETMPPWQGGGNMIKDVRLDETTFNGLPNKFEAGTPNVADAIGLGVALDYVQKIGLANIARYEHQLTDYGMEKLAKVSGVRLIGTAREKVGVLSFVHNRFDNESIGKYLDSEGIAVRAGHHCTQPSLRRFGVESTVRPSLAFYNTYGEIDKLVDVLKRMDRSHLG